MHFESIKILSQITHNVSYLFYCMAIKLVHITTALQVLDINFDYDSVKKQYTSLQPTPDTAQSPSAATGGGGEGSSLEQQQQQPPAPSPASVGWVFNEQINDSSSGYQLTQLCHCFSTLTPSFSPVTSPNAKSLAQHTSEGGAAALSEGGSENRQRVPTIVTVIQYSTDMNL